MDQTRVEERAYSQLERLHGMEVSKEAGGQVALGQARILCRILDIPHDGLTGMRENYVEGPNETLHMGVTKCVDLSDVLEECDKFET